MNRPIESTETETIIERNAYKRTLDQITAFVWGKRGPVAQGVMALIDEGKRELSQCEPEDYQG